MHPRDVEDERRRVRVNVGVETAAAVDGDLARGCSMRAPAVRRDWEAGLRASVNDELGTFANATTPSTAIGSARSAAARRTSRASSSCSRASSTNSKRRSPKLGDVVSQAGPLRRTVGVRYYGCGRLGDFSEGTVSPWARQAAALIRYLLGEQSKSNAAAGARGRGRGRLARAAHPRRAARHAGHRRAGGRSPTSRRTLDGQFDRGAEEADHGAGDCRTSAGATDGTRSRALIEDGRRNLLLRGGAGSIPVTCPVR